MIIYLLFVFSLFLFRHDLTNDLTEEKSPNTKRYALFLTNAIGSKYQIAGKCRFYRLMSYKIDKQII